MTDAQDGIASEQVVEPVVEAQTPPEEIKAEEAPQEESPKEQEQIERDEKGRFKGVQPRIDELTRARREAEREVAYWRQIAQGANQGNQPPAKPTPDQFAEYGEYVEALTDWKAEQAVNKRMEADSTRRYQESKTQTFVQRIQEARKSIPDFDTVVGASDTPIAGHVSDAIQESEHGPALTYHFAKNPDLLMKLNRMDERSANREIGRLEASFESAKSNPTPAPAKKLTQAPSPASTTSNQGRSTTPSLANASMEEYMQQRKTQGARWAR